MLYNDSCNIIYAYYERLIFNLIIMEKLIKEIKQLTSLSDIKIK